jgi:hypothetical protein
VFLLVLGLSIALATIVPRAMQRTHVRRQNGLLERCRALFVLAVEAIERADEPAARSCLARIRLLEARWRYGNSKPFRVAHALWAIGFGGVGCALPPTLLGIDGSTLPAHDVFRSIEKLEAFISLLGEGSLQAACFYFYEWTDWWAVNDFGDRLERILNAGRKVATVSEADVIRDDLTPEEIFGLGPGFTRGQLDRARRRLVKLLHPDLAHNAATVIRHARQEALKRVNAAYDQLRPRLDGSWPTGASRG